MFKTNEQIVFKGRSLSGYKTHKELLSIPAHKGNANHNHVKIPPTLV
jgi:hypothetical protein